MTLFKFGKRREKNNGESFEENLINYLNKKNNYQTVIQLVLPEVISVLNFSGEWKNILSLTSREERVKKTIEHWEKHAKEFDLLIRIFKDRLISIDAILYNEKLTVVYSLNTSNGIIYYIGNIPQNTQKNELITKLPAAINDFYSYVHDGFVMFPQEDMGLVPANNIYCLGEDLDQDEFFDEYSVNDTYMIFSNGSGDGVVYDLSKKNSSGFTYFHDSHDDCDFHENPISVMCSWIEIAITEGES